MTYKILEKLLRANVVDDIKANIEDYNLTYNWKNKEYNLS